MSILDRRRSTLELISHKGFVSLSELTQALGVSESTARRDLEALEQGGSIRRTHGGAVSIAEPQATRLGFADREATAAAEKRAIAAAISEMIIDNQTVILDGGTTCCQVAEKLGGRRISVITNSVPIAARLGGEVDTEVTLLGGYLYPRTGVTLGAAAEEMLASLRAERLVMSCAAANPDGVFNVNEMMTAVEQRMIAVADEVILAVDHTKFGRRAIAHLCEWSAVDLVVTDAGVDETTRAWLADRGVPLVAAEETA
jgi:DeoR/GlpR family transcriptional regulator of sugar metabolism